MMSSLDYEEIAVLKANQCAQVKAVGLIFYYQAEWEHTLYFKEYPAGSVKDSI